MYPNQISSKRATHHTRNGPLKGRSHPKALRRGSCTPHTKKVQGAAQLFVNEFSAYHQGHAIRKGTHRPTIRVTSRQTATTVIQITQPTPTRPTRRPSPKQRATRRYTIRPTSQSRPITTQSNYQQRKENATSKQTDNNQYISLTHSI